MDYLRIFKFLQRISAYTANLSSRQKSNRASCPVAVIYNRRHHCCGCPGKPIMLERGQLIHGPIRATAPEKLERPTIHINSSRKRFSNRKNLQTPALRFIVNRKQLETELLA